MKFLMKIYLYLALLIFVGFFLVFIEDEGFFKAILYSIGGVIMVPVIFMMVKKK